MCESIPSEVKSCSRNLLLTGGAALAFQLGHARLEESRPFATGGPHQVELQARRIAQQRGALFEV